jgi:hypothetical protein
MTVATTAAALGILIAGSILWLVRRDHLHGSQALWWLIAAFGALAIGFMPPVVDRIGVMFGIAYPPMLLVLLVMAALLLKLLILDINIARRERRMRRLIQKMAILELEMRELREEVARSRGADGARPPALPISLDPGLVRRSRRR